MSSCSRCCHVFYCSVPCQNAAWKEHKPFCDYVTGVTLKKGRRPTSSVVDPHVYLRGVMRVRVPTLGPSMPGTEPTATPRAAP